MMSPLKMWCLLPFAVLLLLSITPTETEVVNEMSDCEGFLLNETLPNIPGVLEHGNIQDQNRYKVICQTYNDTRRFVTLYDTNNKIPVFSAYKYRGGQKERKRPPWMIEPQLEDTNDKNMQKSNKPAYQHQASNEDYKKNSDYNRGHLFPWSYGFERSDKISTCTLTNIVPQVNSFNNGSWQNMENCVKCVLEKYCNNSNGKIEGYVVTGAKPGTFKIKEKVNIPSMLWSAFCCYSQIEKKWIASAHWGNNTKYGPKYLETKTLEELQQELSTGNKRFQVFPGTQCPLKETVAKYYPEINEDFKIKNKNKKKETKFCPPQPTTTSPQPTTTSPQPTTTSPQPTTTSPQPTTTSPQPTTTSPQPTTTSPQPTLKRVPASDAPQH
ncbi:uncharacterized protein LOC113168600 [Anabas testudineus]|uniref:Endonuclease domain-containing 1 protein-like n=1 Tax=Anabas testudineus TaxID=64144 RepID=A0A3Q1JYN4_ANATE|nr:uncharacterized protein LOC113168600 [Anabas testudineus]XP_026225434.1 uncharacterized protein LOC113168600 [Anabas testudineus]